MAQPRASVDQITVLCQKSYTRPLTLHPSDDFPGSLNPTSCPVLPKPYTLHPTPYILHPTSYTLLTVPCRATGSTTRRNMMRCRLWPNAPTRTLTSTAILPTCGGRDHRVRVCACECEGDGRSVQTVACARSCLYIFCKN